MSFYLNWGQEEADYKLSTDALEESYNLQKDSIGDEGLQQLGNQTELFMSMNPWENDELPVAAASMNLSPQQYYDLWSQTKPLNYSYDNNGDSPDVSYLKSMVTTLKDTYVGAKNKFDTQVEKDFGPQLDRSAKINMLLTGLGALWQELNVNWVNSFALEQRAYQWEWAKEKGLDIDKDFARYVGDEATDKNEVPLHIKILSGLVGAREFIRYSGQKGDYHKSQVGLYKNPVPKPGVSDRAYNYMLSKNMVDEFGNPRLAKSDLQVIHEHIPDVLASDNTIIVGGVPRKLSTLEGLHLNAAVMNELYSSGSKEGLTSYFGRNEYFNEAEETREGMKHIQVASNFGDSIRYTLTGSLSGEYSPKMSVYEDIQDLADAELYFLEQHKDSLTDEQYKEAEQSIIQNEQDQLSDMEFDPKHGFNAWIGFTANLWLMVKTDPFYMASKGVGLGGSKVASEEVLTGVGKQFDEHIKAGGKPETFWVDKDEPIQVLAEKVMSLKEVDAPLFSELVVRGFSHHLADKVVKASTVKEVHLLIKDSLTGGYISDIRVDGDMISGLNDFHLQPKVFDDNFLDNFADSISGNNYSADYIRGGASKTGKPLKDTLNSVKATFLGSDIRIPNTPMVQISDVQRSLDLFIKQGRLFSIPTQVIDDLSKKYYQAIQNKQYKVAQNIYYDELILREGALQLKAVWGMSDNEISRFMKEHFDEVRGFTDEGKAYRPHHNKEFYDPNFIDPFTKSQFGHQVSNPDDLLNFVGRAINSAGQAMDLTIQMVDLRATLRATGIRRRLRGRVVGPKHVEKDMDIVREAAESGARGTFFDPETPIGQIIKDAGVEGVPAESWVFNKVVMEVPSALETGAFWFISNFWMPLQLITRIAFPKKIILDGGLRASAKGLNSMFRGFQGWVSMLWNDPDGAMLQVLKNKGVDVEALTSMKGPFRTTKHYENNNLRGRLPASVRKAFGALTEGNADFGIPEVQSLYAKDPKFTSFFSKDKGRWEDTLKTVQKDVPGEFGWVEKTVLNDKYVEDYISFLISQYAGDDWMPLIAGAMRKGMSDEQIMTLIKSEPKLMQMLDDLNRTIQARQHVDGQATFISVVTNDSQLLDFIRHHRMSINNFTGGDQELIDVIRLAKVGKHDLRSFEILKDMNMDSIRNTLEPMIIRNQDNLPASVPGMVEESAEGFLQNWSRFTNAIFYAVGQSEASLMRIPTFKQAYFHYIDSFLPFSTRQSLRDILKVHYDTSSPINLPAPFIKKVKDELARIKLTPEEVDDVLSVVIKPSVTKTDEGVRVLAYHVDGIYEPRILGRSQKQQLELEINIQNAERKAFLTDREIAAVRTGDENLKIGAYDGVIDEKQVVLNGKISEEQLATLRRTIANELGPNTNKDIDKIIADLPAFLLDNPAPSLKELRKALGLGNAKYDDVVRVAQQGGIGAFIDEKSGKFLINNPRSSNIVSELTQSDYKTVLDMNGVLQKSVRNMNFEDINQRAAEASFELHNRLLYNLTEQGYLAAAYRVALPFFEAYREVLGRWALLGTTNTKATAQVAFAYRKGLEKNLIYEDQFGEKYLIVPVGGTALENYVKSGGEGLWTDDIGWQDSGIILKRSFPLSALGVAGGGLMPPLGPVVAIPVGLLTSDNPETRRFLERTVFQFGLPFEGGADDVGDFLAEVLINETMPSTAVNMLNSVLGKVANKGVDEDLYHLATSQALQIAAKLYPELSGNPEELFEITNNIRNNIYQLKAWDRNVNPLVPRMNVLYRANLEDSTFLEWYGEEGEQSGIVWNSFVEMSIIHSLYRDLKIEYTQYMGVRAADYMATEAVIKFLGLDKYSLEDQFTSASLQLRGKSVTTAGKMPRTVEEYDFWLDNQELYDDYSGVVMYFFDGLGEGETDYSSFGYLKGLGMVTPKTKEQFYHQAATYAASVYARHHLAILKQQWEDADLSESEVKIQKALFTVRLAEMFPLAYGMPLDKAKALKKLPGYQIPDGYAYELDPFLLEAAVNDPRFADFAITPVIKEYVDFRAAVLKTIAIVKGIGLANPLDASDWLRTSETDEAQFFRDQLFDKANQVISENPMFAVVFEGVFYNEISKFGFGEIEE